ncbi:hypothetical protein B0A55_00126 [Friedmanniomyces simplex]|uniref:Uncharacterized protein n=1 Tax=Friedmanniomyces simplex TaxID=329884 RepID=A0A4V5NIN9_9PEZI|nr:hypothetical protein B0A55_00126 [Friedmanniomyces simplex]
MPHYLGSDEFHRQSDSRFSSGHAVDQCTSAARVRQHFQSVIGEKQVQRGHQTYSNRNQPTPKLSKLWLGLALKTSDHNIVEVAFVCHDGVYSVDFALHELYTRATEHTRDDAGSAAGAITDHIIDNIRDYEGKHLAKFAGAGISSYLAEKSPGLPARLWADLDILPIVLSDDQTAPQENEPGSVPVELDEMADAMARRYFGPSGVPTPHFGRFNDVQIDIAGRGRFATLEQYVRTVDDRSARTALSYAHSLRLAKSEIAFFTATADGSGTAIMRHALLRFMHLAGVGSTWCVPRARPEMLRILETNESILRGTARPGQSFNCEQQQEVTSWITGNAERLWLSDGAPLAPCSKGGASLIVIDDPHMAVLVTIAKRLDPQRPVIYRSHIDIHPDRVADPTSNTAHVWNWVWSHAKAADVFISHPLAKTLLPQAVPRQRLGYMPPTTDWLDGLNKTLSDRDVHYYLQEFNDVCRHECMPTLAYPGRDFIVQIAPFERSEGVADALAAYAAFRRQSRFCAGKTVEQTPQLVLCSRSSMCGPDQTTVLDQAVTLLLGEYSALEGSVIIVRLPPCDQMINALLSCARVALQLSTHGGFEVTVSQALRKGVPVIARDTSGFPLLVRHNLNGFLVHGTHKSADTRAAADYLDTLFLNEDKYEAMSSFARGHLSNEIGTVGNAMCWMYLADRLTSGHEFSPDGRWIWDLAREHAGEPVGQEETRLPRGLNV